MCHCFEVSAALSKKIGVKVIAVIQEQIKGCY